jgi:selenocysteine lyase/cysteine desulfurase
MTPEAARQAFPITATRAYLFSGGLAPAATPVREAHDRWTEAWTYDPAAPYMAYQHELEIARQRFAALIRADVDEVALVDNTSRGSNLIVQMIDAPPGSNVVVDEYTYPSSIYPWLLAPKLNQKRRFVRSLPTITA